MRYYRFAVALILVLSAVVTSPVRAADLPAYKIVKSVPLGLPDRWDYLFFEPATHRVYVAHETEITVVDGRTGVVVGRLQGVHGVNGITAIPALGKGYTDSRAKKAAVAFDLKTLKVTKEIPADIDTDGIVYDPATKRIVMVEGDAMTAVVIDAQTDTTVATIPLDGKPESLVSDDAGRVYINIEDKREIVRLGVQATAIEARWPISECESPHGLAMDRATHRLFSSCKNAKMVVVDSDTGKVLATLPIGKGTDGAAFDPGRKLAFSSNGEGTLSVIAEQGPDKFVQLGDEPTKPLARTIALDPATGRIYLVTADVDELNPKAENPRQRYRIKPGTVQLLFLDPS